MTSARDEDPLTPEEERRLAWMGLGKGALWSLVLLLAVGVALAALFELNAILPVWVGVTLLVIIAAGLLEGVFLHPLMHALFELFRVYVGRAMWRAIWVRRAFWGLLAVLLLCGMLPFLAQRRQDAPPNDRPGFHLTIHWGSP